MPLLLMVCARCFLQSVAQPLHYSCVFDFVHSVLIVEIMNTPASYSHVSCYLFFRVVDGRMIIWGLSVFYTDGGQWILAFKRGAPKTGMKTIIGSSASLDGNFKELGAARCVGAQKRLKSCNTLSMAYLYLQVCVFTH